MKGVWIFVIVLLSNSLYSQSAFAPYERALWIQPTVIRSEYNNPFLPSPYQIHVLQTTVQYGFTDRLTLDGTVGFGKIEKISNYYPYAGVEFENPSTTKHGFIDSRFGMRYKIFDEMESKYEWMPTISFRVGGIKKGDYDRRPQSLGDGGSGGEVNLYFAKDFNFYGFGSFGEIGHRKRENPIPDDRLYAIFLYKNLFNRFFLFGGYRGQRSLGGFAFADPAQNESQFPNTNPSDTNTPVSLESLAQSAWLARERPDWARRESFLRREISIGYRDDYGNFYSVFYSQTVSGVNTPFMETIGLLVNINVFL